MATARLATAAATIDTGQAAATEATPTASATSDDLSAPRTLDLPTALAMADRYNRTIAAAEAGVAASVGQVDVARSALLPVANLRGGYSWYSDAQTSSVDIDPALLPPGTPAPVVTVRQKDFVTANATLRLAIDVSGELRKGLDAAQSSYRAEKARSWATRLDEERTVVTTYLDLLEAMRLREVAEQTVALHERQLADASSRFEQGQLMKNGVLVVQVALADSRQRVLQLDNVIAARRRSLNRAVGLDVDAATRVSDVSGRPSLPALDDAVASAHDHNPLVGAMLEEVQAADDRASAAKRGRLPHFSTNTAYDVTSADTLSPNDYASIGVGVEWDIASLRREGEIVKLEADSKRTRLVLDRTTREVEGLVRAAHDSARERLSAIDSVAVAVGQAEENLRIREAQFDAGRATSEDVLDAGEILARQRAMLASALYQAHARRAELQQLMGLPLDSLADTAATGETHR
jgi:outer membrane protein